MSNKKYTKKDCIESLKKAANKVDGKLSSNQYKEMGCKPGFWAIDRRFDSWNKAKEAAGLNVYDSHSATKEKRRSGIPEILSISDDEWKDYATEQRYRARQKAWVAEKKLDRGCDKCNYDDHPRALHYHHINPSEKDFGISKGINSGYGKNNLENEIEKCELLCANCHSVEESDTYNVSGL
jgi:hypothetical protein